MGRLSEACALPDTGVSVSYMKHIMRLIEKYAAYDEDAAAEMLRVIRKFADAEFKAAYMTGFRDGTSEAEKILREEPVNK